MSVAKKVVKLAWFKDQYHISTQVLSRREASLVARALRLATGVSAVFGERHNANNQLIQFTDTSGYATRTLVVGVNEEAKGR